MDWRQAIVEQRTAAIKANKLLWTTVFTFRTPLWLNRGAMLTTDLSFCSGSANDHRYFQEMVVIRTIGSSDNYCTMGGSKFQ